MSEQPEGIFPAPFAAEWQLQGEMELEVIKGPGESVPTLGQDEE